MSFAALIGFILKLSRLFLKIHRWVLLKMSLSCKISGSNGKFPTNLKLKKARDPVHGPNWFTKWKIKFLVLWLLGLFITGSIWVFSSFSDGAVGRQGMITPAACEEAAPILLEHFNVSNALVSPFSESDQISAFRCMKQSGSEMPLVNDLTCATEFPCLEKQEFCKQERWNAEQVETNDQCPIQDELIHRELEQSTIPEKCLSYVFQSGISSISRLHQISRQIILQIRATGDSVKGHCWSVCFCFITMLKMCWWILVAAIVRYKMPRFYSKFWKYREKKLARQESQQLVQHKHQQKQQQQSLPKAGGNWRMKVLVVFVITGIIVSVWLFIHFYWKHKLNRKETLANMCDERARMLQDQFNVSLNHVHALAILVSTFHHGKLPSAIDQKTFGEYTERTAFERPLTSGVAYAVKVVHSERERFEQQCGWRIKKMATEDQTSLQDCIPENLDPAPIQDEYAPVIFSQETVSHIVSIDMMSGKEDRENIIRARTSGKGVLTSPFKLLKSNHLGVILTFAVYNIDLPLDATPQQRNEATVGYLGASYDVPSLVEKLLHQLASKETIVVNVYDTTNSSAPINMYGDDVTDTGLLQICPLDFGDPVRKHEMHCRFKQQPPLPWTAINSSVGVLVITLLAAQIFYAAISRIAKVESNLRKMEELKVRAEAADVAKSQFLATVSHEIRTPMNGVLGMLQMLMDTDLDANQQDYAQTAHASGRDLISLINEVLDQAKIESGRLELEAVPFDLRSVLDNVLSLFSGKSNEKGIELAVYVSNQVPEVVIGDPGRFRQIITNLVGNSIKFTHDKGHIFVTVHLADEVWGSPNVRDKVLTQGLHLVQDSSGKTYNTLSGYPVVDRWKSWEKFKKLKDTEKMEKCDMIKLLVTVEDTGVGIPLDAQSRIFTPFMQADSSTSRTYGGTGIGLSISNCLVDLMGGEIGFVSETGTGSTFSFTGALRKGEVSSLDKKWQHYDPAASEFRGMRALVIDKRSIRAEVTKYHLQRLGISVDISSCLKHAISYICSTSELADLAMVLIDKEVWDKEDAVALHQSLKERRQNSRVQVPVNLPKIFLLATSISPTECNELKTSGLVDNVMTKPLRLSFIISSFQDALGKKRQANRKKPSTLGHLLRGRRILVVDDNVVNRRVAEGALKKYGAIVTCVESGKAALALLKPPHDFDACFMDLQMPEMDGFEATRQVRSVEGKINEKIASGEVSKEMYGDVSHWHTPILAMTADVIQATNEECMKCGMDEYVSKPFEEEQLYSAVARFFETG